MATTIGALAYKIDLDSKDFSSGMKLNRKELGLVKKAMEATDTPLQKMHASLEVLNRDNVKSQLGAEKHAEAIRQVRLEYANSIKPAERAAKAIRKVATASKSASTGMSKAKPSLTSFNGGMNSLASSIMGKFAVGAVAFMAWQKFTQAVRAGAQLAVNGVKAMIAHISDLDDRLNIQKKVGVTSKQFEAMAIAGQKSGLSIQSIGTSIQRMTRRLSEAALGNGEALGALQELGLDPKKLNAKGPYEALRSIAVALSKVENQSDKLRIAFKLFDSEGAQFVNVIGDGTAALDDAAAKAEKFGQVLTKTQQGAISKTAAKFVDFQSIMGGVFTQLTAIGAPAFLKVAERAEELGLMMLDVIKNHGPQIQDIFDDVANVFMIVSDVIEVLIEQSATLFKNWESFRDLALIQALGPMGLLVRGMLNMKKGAAVGGGAAEKKANAAEKAADEQVKQQKETNRLLKEQQRNKVKAPGELNTLSVKFLGHLH